ncbi:DNA repair protein RAD51 homolog 4-like [Littorina saxatilis]|uniref:DNA repair protein RAD51 homolog 4-like n=1 Tax=Littorina saxatilis TaxID=31220 RepID=UPI0038B54710
MTSSILVLPRNLHMVKSVSRLILKWVKSGARIKMSALRPWMCKALTDKVWLLLRDANINTVIDFVVRDREEIARTCCIAYKDVVSIGRVLMAQFSTFPLTGLQLYTNIMSSHAILSTGIASLDELLDGGLYAGELCELAGEAASGKTQVCMRCAVTVATVHAQNTMYIDTCGSFAGQNTLQHLPGAHTQEKTGGQHGNVKLIVVDCVAAIFSPILGGQQMDSLALIEHLGRQLKSMAADCSVACLITNNLTSGVEGECQPCLGKVWAHVPHTRVLMGRDSCSDTSRKFTVVKSVRVKTPVTVLAEMNPEYPAG